MKTEHDQKHKVAEASSESPDRPSTVSRRAVIRGVAAAVPTIMTLRSGAAVASTSYNYIGADPGEPVDDLNRHLCVDVDSVLPADPDRANVYDLGDPPSADITAIPADRVYRTEKNMGSRSIEKSGADICLEGDRDGLGYWYYDSGTGDWVNVHVPPNGGFMVSADALNSFTAAVLSGDIKITEI